MSLAPDQLPHNEASGTFPYLGGPHFHLTPFHISLCPRRLGTLVRVRSQLRPQALRPQTSGPAGPPVLSSDHPWLSLPRRSCWQYVLLRAEVHHADPEKTPSQNAPHSCLSQQRSIPLEVLGVSQVDATAEPLDKPAHLCGPFPYTPRGPRDIGSEDCASLKPYLFQQKATPSSRILSHESQLLCGNQKREKHFLAKENFLWKLKSSGSIPTYSHDFIIT